MKKALQAIKQSWDILKTSPSLATPFVLFALLEGITLYILFLAPQEPFAKLLAPPIAHFFGEQSIRYPGHLLALPQVFPSVKLFLGYLPGMFISAYFIGLIADVKLTRKTSRRYKIKNALHRFFSLFIIYIFAVSIFFIWIPRIGVIKPFNILFLQAAKLSDSQGYILFLQFLFHFLSFWVQILFLYALPLVILAEQSLFKALIGNFRYLGRLFVPTTACIFLAALIYLGVYIFEKDLIRLAARTKPEIIVVVLAAGIPLTLIINLLVTTATTLLFIDEQETDPTVSLDISKEESS